MLSNCDTREDSWESLGLPGDQTNHKGNQSWIFTRRTDAEAEVSIVWPLGAKSQLVGKDPDAGEDWRQEKGMAPNEMDSITDSMDMDLSWLWDRWSRTEEPGVLKSMGSQRVRPKLSIWLSNWITTTLKVAVGIFFFFWSLCIFSPKFAPTAHAGSYFYF